MARWRSSSRMPAMEGTQDSSSAGISTPGSRRGTTVTSTSPTRRTSSRASRTASGCPSAGSRPTSDPDLRLPSGNEQWAYPQLRTSATRTSSRTPRSAWGPPGDLSRRLERLVGRRSRRRRRPAGRHPALTGGPRRGPDHRRVRPSDGCPRQHGRHLRGTRGLPGRLRPARRGVRPGSRRGGDLLHREHLQLAPDGNRPALPAREHRRAGPRRPGPGRAHRRTPALRGGGPEQRAPPRGRALPARARRGRTGLRGGTPGHRAGRRAFGPRRRELRPVRRPHRRGERPPARDRRPARGVHLLDRRQGHRT
ncbi:hypothetical protein RKD41_007101 [Streptomyces tendae]